MSNQMELDIYWPLELYSAMMWLHLRGFKGFSKEKKNLYIEGEEKKVDKPKK